MFAKDYRAQARAALRGKWLRCALLMLLALVLGASAVGGNAGVSVSVSDVENYMDIGQSLTPEQKSLLTIVSGIILCLSLWSFFMGSYVNLGLTHMFDHTLEGETPRARMLFPKGLYWKSLGLNFLRSLFIGLWSLLFIIPGIVAAYRYAMADYLLCIHPEMGVMDALRESKTRMMGRKWRMFCLEWSFVGWQLLSLVPVFICILATNLMGAFMGETEVLTAGTVVLLAICALLSLAASLFVQVYENTALVAFFRDAQRAGQWQEDARSGENYASAAYGETQEQEGADAETEFAQSQKAYADESAARAMFVNYAYSRRRMQEAGVLEEYEAMNASSVSEMRWVREYADALMRRFDQDSAALDDILSLAAEYALADLCDRALQRVERHARQETLPNADVLNMAGRMLALLTSGIFEQDAGFVKRKCAQILELANRLEERLNADEPDGEWQKVLALIREMGR